MLPACLGLPCVAQYISLQVAHPSRVGWPGTSLLLYCSTSQASERLAEVLGRAAAALPAAEPLWRQRLGRTLALELPLTALLEAEVHPPANPS